MLSIFSCASWPSVCLFISSTHFFVCFFPRYWDAWAVCIFWRIIPCRLLCLQIYFSPIRSVAFPFVYGFLSCEKLLSFIKSHLLIFALTFITLGDGPKRILLWFMSRGFCLRFPLRIVQCLILRVGLLSMSSLLLCVVSRSVLISSFYTLLSTFLSTT